MTVLNRSSVKACSHRLIIDTFVLCFRFCQPFFYCSIQTTYNVWNIACRIPICEVFFYQVCYGEKRSAKDGWNFNKNVNLLFREKGKSELYTEEIYNHVNKTPLLWQLVLMSDHKEDVFSLGMSCVDETDNCSN